MLLSHLFVRLSFGSQVAVFQVIALKALVPHKMLALEDGERQTQQSARVKLVGH